MRNANNTTWTIKSFGEDGSTSVREGISHGDAVKEIYRAMGAWHPEPAALAGTTEPVEPAERAETREPVAA